MNRIVALAVLVAAAALPASGCGGGGSSSDGAVASAGLSLRVLWQTGPDSPAPSGSPTASKVAGGSPTDAVADFGQPLPPAVVQGRVIVRSAGFGCCMAFDPRASVLGGERRFVVTSLPAGLTGVQISGFGTLPVPAQPTGRCRPTNGDPLPDQSEALATCSALPGGLAIPCAPDSCSVPSFDSGPDAAEVTLVNGEERSAGDVATPRQPFLLDQEPPCGGAVGPGGELSVKVVESFIDGEATPVLTPQSVAVTVTQIDRVAGQHVCPAALPPDAHVSELSSVACSDRPATGISQTCSDPGSTSLDVGGVVASGDVNALELETGCVEVRVQVNGHEPLCYDALVETSAPTATRTPSPTPTPAVSPTQSPLATPTPSAVSTATPRPTSSPFVTPTSNPSRTPSATGTPISSATPRPTPTGLRGPVRLPGLTR